MDESWLVIICTMLWVLITAKVACPPGPSFTSAWLFIGFQGYLLESASVLKCFHIGGAGLILGWYGCQVFDSSAWPRIMNIWIPKFPWAPRGALSASVRIADLYIHALPFYMATRWRYSNEVTFGLTPWLQILLLERCYFLVIDGNILGDGRGVNYVYRIQPRAPAKFFWTLQGLSVAGQLICLINELFAGSVSQNGMIHYFFSAMIACSIAKAHVLEFTSHSSITLKGLSVKDSAKSAAKTFCGPSLYSIKSKLSLLYLFKQSIVR